jgi:hypothetical protein
MQVQRFGMAQDVPPVAEVLTGPSPAGAGFKMTDSRQSAVNSVAVPRQNARSQV